MAIEHNDTETKENNSCIKRYNAESMHKAKQHIRTQQHTSSNMIQAYQTHATRYEGKQNIDIEHNNTETQRKQKHKTL